MNLHILKSTKHIGCMLLTAILVLVAIPLEPITITEAASSYTVKFKILATSDIHGAVNSKDQETGLTNLNTAGLNKVATLINQQRNAVGTANTLLLDNGDFLSDYSTDYIYTKFNSDVQPVLKAMNRLKYDAITLGNHEFDYSDSYFKNQMKKAGLLSKIVCCNVFYKDTNKSVYTPSKVITKSVKTTSGKTIKVKVGVIGATRPVLSAKRQLHSDSMVTKAVVSSVKGQITQLKKKGAQIIVVATHGGMGNGKTSSSETNVAYAISKLKGVDAIIAGHTHETFPASNYSTNGLSHVNKTTGMVNGVPLVIPGSNARGLGVIDMKLKVDSKGKVLSKSSTASFDQVVTSTKSNSTIQNYFSKYDKALNTERQKVVANLDSSTVLTNLDMVVKDTSIMQVVNDAKLSFAAEYLSKNYPSLSSSKIVACTRLNSTGVSGSNDFIYASNKLTQAQLAQMVSYEDNLLLGKITGKQLKEWLEFSASIYETAYGNYPSLSYYESKFSAHPLLARTSSQFSYWNNFFVFDGVTYEIDLSKKPRYNSNASVISNSRRIVNLKYNGVTVKDTDSFIVVSGNEDDCFSFMPKETSKSTNLLYSESSAILTSTVVFDYIKKTAASNNGKLSVQADHNWRLLLPSNYKFHLFGSKYKTYASYIKSQPWYKGILYERSSLAKTFYYGQLTGTETAKAENQALVVSSNTATTNKPVQLSVLGNGLSSDKSVSWLRGVVRAADSTSWDSAIRSKNYSVNTNGDYSAKITFSNGAVVCKVYKVSNINPNYIAAPSMSDWFTNRTGEAKGVAEPLSTVTLNDGHGHVYKTKANASGSFTIPILYPVNYRTRLTLQAYKEVGGTVRYSSKSYVSTIKSGPDAATVKTVKNGSTTIQGTLENGAQIAVRYSGTVYVQKGKKALYKASSGYKTGTKIEEVKVEYGKNNSYKLYLPKGLTFKKGREVRAYSYEKLKAVNIVITGKANLVVVK